MRASNGGPQPAILRAGVGIRRRNPERSEGTLIPRMPPSPCRSRELSRERDVSNHHWMEQVFRPAVRNVSSDLNHARGSLTRACEVRRPERNVTPLLHLEPKIATWPITNLFRGGNAVSAGSS
jgi:hypothetical protein